MMIRLYPEQLRAQLTEGLRAAYLLLGNDPLLLQESQDAIREAAAAQGDVYKRQTISCTFPAGAILNAISITTATTTAACITPFPLATGH